MVLFTLTGLNVDVGLYEFIEYPTYDFPDVSASYYLDLSLNAADFNSVFYFKTTDPELTGSPGILADASDMAFKCESSNWPDISFSEGVISNNVRSDIDNYLPPPSATMVHYNKNIGVQWLAKNITGGYNNSDLFANEEALVKQYVTLDSIPGHVPGPNQFPSNFLNKSYKYYRAIFPTINTNVINYPTLGFDTNQTTRTHVAIVYIEIFSEGSKIDLNNISASDEYPGIYEAINIGTEPSSSVNNMWLSGHRDSNTQPFIEKYNTLSGEYVGTSRTTTNTIDLSGEWIQWDHDTPINISLFKIRTGGMFYHKADAGNDTYIGTPPNRIVLVGRNDENHNWNIIYDNTYPFHYETYTIVFGTTIKGNITNTLDVSGGSDTEPLSNADTGRNNVSREALLHLLDNDISGNVQRVHSMIADASSATVDSNGIDISAGDTSNLWIPIRFEAGDTLKFKLIYKPDQITDSNGVAIDDSGNELGTNTIDEQDYVVRLNLI